MIGYLDCFSGVSGDKFLGALVDAGLDARVLQSALDAVLPGEGVIACERVRSAGISATLVTVSVSAPATARRWADLRAALSGSGLAPDVRDRALAVFEVLAEAEGRVHGTAPDDVHFHEVGAVDSVADIVGACAGLAELGLGTLVCSPVAVGSGTVATSHGVLPVPAPATVALLEGVPIVPGPASGELTTPTGAALVRVLASGFGAIPALTPVRSGYGAGSRLLEDAGGAPVPNVLRLTLGAVAAGAAAGDAGAPDEDALTEESVTVLRTVIDHVGAERVAFALERVMEAGALDAWQRPVVMKKGRLGTEVTVLSAPGRARELAAVLVRHTGTLGVRIEPTTRYVAGREAAAVATPLGEVRLKVGPGAVVRPEHDDLARIARDNGLTLKEAEALTMEALEASGDTDPGGSRAG
jgi:uncharacterized protein (TIGR00299 family) protein